MLRLPSLPSAAEKHFLISKFEIAVNIPPIAIGIFIASAAISFSLKPLLTQFSCPHSRCEMRLASSSMLGSGNAKFSQTRISGGSSIFWSHVATPSAVSTLADRHSYVFVHSYWQCILPLVNFPTVSHPSDAFRAVTYSFTSGHSPHFGSKLSPAAIVSVAFVQLVFKPEQATLQSLLRIRNDGTLAQANVGDAPRPRLPS